MSLPDYITSIEYHEITVSDGNSSNSANLDGSVTETNCVPFMSVKIDGTLDDWDDINCDVYFSAGSPPTVTVERMSTDGDITARVFVVEFDGSNVEVQQDTFAMTTSDTTDDVTISSVTEAKAFVLAYWKFTTGGDDDFDHAWCTVEFTSSTNIRLTRDEATGAIGGHVYTVEAQGTEFATEAFSMTIAVDATQATDTISTVTMAKTMIVANFLTDVSFDDADDAAPRVWLGDTTTVYAERATFNNLNTITVKGWAVEFAGDETVQRGTLSYLASGSDVTKTTDISEVTQANSIINNPSQSGCMESAGDTSTEVEGAFQALKFVDSDTIQGDRGEGSADADGSWEVIDFTSAGAPTPTYSGKMANRGVMRGVMGK